MYILLFVLHGVFIGITHLLGYTLLEGLFIILLLFFLLYFSPLFFSRKDQNFPSFSFPKISFSLQESLLLPMIFFYTAFFFLLFAVTGNFFISLQYNIIFLISTYILLFLYITAFEWKNYVFFDIARIHIFFSYCVVLILLFFTFFIPQIITVSFFVFFLCVIIFSFIYFLHSKDADFLLFQCFLFVLMFFGHILIALIQGEVLYVFTLFSFGISALVLFELMPKYDYFHRFLPLSRIYILITFLLSYLIGIVGAIFDVRFYGFIIVGIIFLFFIHIRYSNYVTLFGALFGTFFLYSLIFFPLITQNSILSTLLFVFFLPLCIIGNTYFWEEKFPYDLKVLHYSSIVFSCIFSLYVLIFIAWGSVLFFMLSLSIFCLGFLFLLSYFRFRT